jgi:predicted dithiol-disulfide oxidoreductase (DUF899 family)
MSLPDIASREEWLVARKALLAREKELTSQKDARNADRRRMPMVAVEKEYEFEGPEGNVPLLDLFDGRRQLIIQHFMFWPSWDDGWPSCTAAPDGAKLRWALDEEQPFEIPGLSFFLRDGDAIFYTNSVFARGTEWTADSYGLLDHTALGRQEDWEEPKGRADDPHGPNPDFS